MGDVVRTPRQLAQVLKAHRKQMRLTQREASEKVGLLPKTVSALELRPGASSLDSFFRLIAALNLELVVQERAASRPAGDAEW